MQLFLPLHPSLASSFPPSLPRWYLIAVKQEAGEQTAGEPTLILSCAICCGHMTELQTRSNAMMPHHTWHIDQSWPKEQKRDGERERERSDSEWKQSKDTSNALWRNYDSLYHLVLTCRFGFLSGLFSIIKTDMISQNLISCYETLSKMLYFIKLGNETLVWIS